MKNEGNFYKEILEEQDERMQNIRKYYPFFSIAGNSLEQFREGKYANIDMGFILMAILRMLIEENNFNDRGVTYREYYSFTKHLLIREYELYLSEDEYDEIINYIFDKIKNDGKPFEFNYYEPVTKTKKTARVRLVESSFYQNNVYYYITPQGIEFYLDTKEIKDESKISIQQILLEKMITSKNFSGGIEVVKRINNEVSKLRYRKKEVLTILGYDIKEGIIQYEDFFATSIKWFDEEHQLFVKNQSLIEKAVSLVNTSEQGSMEEIGLLESELKRAIAKHSELLSSCMDLKKKADEIIARTKINSLKMSFDFKDFLTMMVEKDDASLLNLIVHPLMNLKRIKHMDLFRLEDVLTYKLDEIEDLEVTSEAEEEDYVFEDVVEEQRISHNFVVMQRCLFDMLKEQNIFYLSDYNNRLEQRYTNRIYTNGDYYSFVIHMCHKYEYDVSRVVENPDTFFEKIMVELFKEKNTDQYKQLKFRIEPISEEEMELPSGFSVTNIRFEKVVE